jgi:hypothetical protein
VERARQRFLCQMPRLPQLLQGELGESGLSSFMNALPALRRHPRAKIAKLFSH